MSKNYYVLSNGRVRQEKNTVYIENTEGKKTPLPVENIESLYLYGEVDLNTRLLNFLSKKRITLHVFNYYGYYAGSYYPRDYLHSGFLLVRQAEHYSSETKRVALAKEFVRASAHSLLRNVVYYERRRGKADASEPVGEVGTDMISEPERDPRVPTDGETETEVDTALFAPLPAEGEEFDPFAPPPDEDGDATLAMTDRAPDAGAELSRVRLAMEKLSDAIDGQSSVGSLLGVEGKLRQRYYAAWEHLLVGDDWSFSRRVRRPPDNEINSLISFGNGHLYTVCLSELYRTQLTPTISYLHEPGARRFSLALDLSEIFKPLIVDRTIFTLLNRGQLKKSHFDRDTDGCFLNDVGRKLFLNEIERRLGTTIKHRRLNRHVTYRHLIRLECYKLIRHLSGLETYKAFRAWW